jgi:hypothetical protein
MNPLSARSINWAAFSACKITPSRRGWRSTIALDTGGPLCLAIDLVYRLGSIKRKTWM